MIYDGHLMFVAFSRAKSKELLLLSQHEAYFHIQGMHVKVQVSSLLINTRPRGPSVTTYSTIPTNNVTADCDMQNSFMT